MMINMSIGLYNKLTEEIQYLNVENNQLTTEVKELKNKLNNVSQIINSNEFAIAAANHDLGKVRNMVEGGIND